jgi:hypothetical protein
MTINNVLASPSFAAWMQGEPLNIQRLFYTPAGKPRVAVLSIAHLNDQERMFFVTILLNELITWMRSQAGTSSLRALLYMDEVFGYLPPTANPPSKVPMLALLKQARAFGLGLILSTQNPVDLDYKALSNAGSWFLGRLQTERDKARVLDGLEGATSAAGGKFNRQQTERILSGLGSRVFLMNNVHEDQPVVYQTRWALSYLRGPMTREQIQQLMKDRKAELAPETMSGDSSPAAAGGMAAVAAHAPPPVAPPVDEPPPVLPPEIRQCYAAVARSVPRSAPIVYRPAILGAGRLHFVESKSKVDSWTEVARVCSLVDDLPRDPWDDSDVVALEELAMEAEPVEDARFATLPDAAARKKQYDVWTGSLKSYLYRSERLPLSHCPSLKLYSEPGQTEGDFRVLLKNEAREQRDLEIEKLRKKYSSKMGTLEDRLRRAEQKVEVEKGQASNAAVSAAVSPGSSVLGALFGRKLGSSSNVSRVGTSVRAAGRAASQRGDISRAKDNVRALEDDIEDLNERLEEEIEEISESLSLKEIEIEPHPIKPRKSDISVDDVALLWLPYTVDDTGIADPA